MALAVDLEHLLFRIDICDSSFFFNFKAVVCSPGTFHVEEVLTLHLVAFDTDSYLQTISTANLARLVEFGVVHLIYLHWCLRSNLEGRVPHCAAVVYPVV